MKLSTILFGTALLLASLAAESCTGDTRPSATVGKAEQQAMTPDQAIARLKDGNQRFTGGHGHDYDHLELAAASAKGQYPFATVLSCIDSRSTPEVVFDLAIGDAFVPRIAGNIATTEIIGSMEFACKVAGAKVIVVLGHDSCGAVKGACDGVKLGNLTAVLAGIDPAVAATATAGERTAKNAEFVHHVAEENVRLTVALIRARSPLLAEMEAKGELKIVGAMQELATGRVTWF